MAKIKPSGCLQTGRNEINEILYGDFIAEEKVRNIIKVILQNFSEVRINELSQGVMNVNEMLRV
jgi:hypothetical protein